jgi:hypothetical protein
MEGPSRPSARSIPRIPPPAEGTPQQPSGASLIPPLPPPPSAASAGQPSGKSSSQSQSQSGPLASSALSQNKASGHTPSPSSVSITGPLGPRSDPLGISGERDRPRSTQTQAPQPSSQLRVILAVVLGIVVGVLAVLMLQLMGGRPHR